MIARPQQPVECDLYLPGHLVHWIQTRKASTEVPRWGMLVSVVDEEVITVEYLDRVSRYRNHQAGGLLDVAAPGTRIGVCERYGILRVYMDQRISKTFCVANADDGWTPCSCDPLISATPQSLNERLSIRGGFTVLGTEILRGLEASDD